jgi:NADPH:quinone reductase-like Zn-dependent oxidoreductase
MKAVIFNTTGDWETVLEATEAALREPAANEVQVQVFCRPLNPSDEMFINGVYRLKPTLPQTAGLEGAGVITKCGAGIDPSYVNCRVVFRAKGTWAEYINLTPDQVRLTPREIPFETACQLSLNTLTAYALLEMAQVKAGGYLLLTAAGSSVAQQVIQLAKEKNIRTIAVIRDDNGREKLERLGADLVLNTEKVELLPFLEQQGIRGVNASLDAVGGPLGSALIQAAAPFSRIVIYGRYSPDAVRFTNADVIYKNLTIAGFGIDAWAGSKTREQLDDIWEEIFRSVMKGSLLVPHDKVFALERFKEAIRSYKAGEGRILIK